MNELLEFLRNNRVRIEFGDRWLISRQDGTYIVYMQWSRKKPSIVLYEGDNLADAVKKLEGMSDE
jgi:hypothetical protein